MNCVSDPGRRSIKAFAVSQTKADVTLVASVSPVLQTRAPTGKLFGPVVTSLESSPTTFHVIGVMVRIGCARAGSAVKRIAPSRAAKVMAARGGLGRFMQSVVRFGWALYAGTRNISVLSTGVRGDRLYFIRLMRVRGMDMSRSRVSGSRLIAGAIGKSRAHLSIIWPPKLDLEGTSVPTIAKVS